MEEVYLVGARLPEFQCTGTRNKCQLPNKQQVLQVFFYYKDESALDIRASASKTIQKLYEFWNANQEQDLRRDIKAVYKLERLYKEWTLVRKNRNRTTKAQQKKEKAFVKDLQNEFSVQNVRVSSLPPKSSQSSVSFDSSASDKVSEKESSDSDNDNISESENSDNDSETETKLDKRSVLTLDLAASLDRANVSDRMATPIILAAVKPLEKAVKKVKFTISRSSIQRFRKIARQKISSHIKSSFKPVKRLTVHWDGKQLEDYHGRLKFDRLPILVSGDNVSKLLCAPPLPRGTGRAQATAVCSALNDWGLSNHVDALCSDTEATNTGPFNGAAKIIEDTLEKELLYLACRHHVLEIPLEAAVKVAMGEFCSKDMPLFKLFREMWEQMDKAKYEQPDRSITRAIAAEKADVVAFLQKQILERQPRDDYLELAELLLIFAGEVPARGICFRFPGAVSRTRWMMYVIYAVKIWLFQKQFPLTRQQKKGIKDICIYAFKIHAVHWYTAPAPLLAPRMDLLLIKKLHLLSEGSCIAPLATAALDKMKNHGWYLGEHLVPLAFFDPEVPADEKVKMVNALKTRPSSGNARRAVSPSPTASLADFVTEKSRFFFDRLGIDQSFLQKDPHTWEQDASFWSGREISLSLLPVNDIAERGVKLVTDYINGLCKKEEEFQMLLQVVELHRKLCPNLTKGEIKSIQLNI